MASLLTANGDTFTSVGPQPLAAVSGENNLLRHGGFSSYHILDIANGTAARPDAAIGSMISTYQPDIVLLMVGTNDRLSTMTVDILKSRYNTLLDNLFAQGPNTRVVMASPPNAMPDPTANRAAFTLMAETAVSQVVSERKSAGRNISFLDLVGSLDTATDVMAGELVHPNALGNQKLAARFFEGIHSPQGTNFQAVPEPASLLALSGCLAMVARRRQAKSSPPA